MSTQERLYAFQDKKNGRNGRFMIGNNAARLLATETSWPPGAADGSHIVADLRGPDWPNVPQPKEVVALAYAMAAALDLLAACEDAIEKLKDDENYVGENGGEAEFLINLRKAVDRARNR